jgi:hypothetical protein
MGPELALIDPDKARPPLAVPAHAGEHHVHPVELGLLPDRLILAANRHRFL